VTAPLISVIIPVYNVSEHIAACIASLRAQTLGDFQAIVVDDGSEDDSVAQARQAIGEDPRFHLIRQGNHGLSGARNTGLDHATGQFIAFIDSDDRVAPDYLRNMWQALEDSGADWVACGIEFCFPDGTSTRHSAIHGQAARHSSGRVTRFALNKWEDAIRHFPSAWNKLYRRSLIEGLRVPEGTWFEDHGFFYRAAARTDHILHLAQPLYLQTRGRAGQITGADDDRVFDQFGVLEDIRQQLGTAHPGGGPAFDKIASRLLFERSTALRDPARRARYAQACADYLDRHGMQYQTDWDPHISRAWGLEMAGTLPLSVVIPWTGQDPQPLLQTLEALAIQGAPGREILIVCDGAKSADQARNVALSHPNAQVLIAPGTGLGAAWNAGLEHAQGRYVCFLEPGDRLAEMALHAWVDGALKSGADMVISAFRQGIGTGDTHCGFVDEAGAARLRQVASPGALTPTEALLLEARPGAKLYARAFLSQGKLRFGTGALPGWQMALGAALAARSVLYMPWAGLDSPMAPLARRSPAALARALDALGAALPPKDRARLAPGWWRQLFARALWQQLSQTAPPRSAPAKALFAAGAGWAALRRGQTRQRTALDPGMGLRIEQLLSLEALLRGQKPPAVAAPDGSAHNSIDFIQDSQDLHMQAFFVQGVSRICFRAEFSEFPYANISFFDRDQTNILFHLSLRHEDGLAVCNKRTGEVWGKELPQQITLPRSGVEVDITFDAPEVRVRLDGELVFKFSSGLVRTRFPHLDQIGYMDFQGGLITSGMDINIGQGEEASEALTLNNRLELRTRLEHAPKDLTLLVPGMQTPPPMIPRPLSGGRVDLRALLPGRVWDHVPPKEALQVSLVAPDGTPACAPLLITRAQMAQLIDTLLTTTDLQADAMAAMQALEHIRFGGLLAHLSAPARTALNGVQRFYDLADYLQEPGTETDPQTEPNTAQDAPELSPQPEPDPVAQAQAQFGQTMRAAPQTDPLELLQALTQELPEPLRPYLFLGLSEFFCAPAQDFEAFHALYAAQGYAGALSPEPGDIWKNSALLPFLLLENRIEELRTALWGLTEPTNDWTVTPAVAWVAERVINGAPLGEETSEDILYAYMELVDKRIWDYWGRAHCVALTRAAVTLVLQRDHFAHYMQQGILDFICRAYGLSRQFWQMLDAALDGAPLPAPLVPARQAFDLVAQSAQDASPRDGLDQALSLFTRYGTPEALRMRRELLGPAGVQLPKGTAPSYGALIREGLHAPEATLRHMAFPGAAEVGEDLSALAAQVLPEFYPEVPRAPYYQLQCQTGAAVQALLEQAPKTPISAAQIAGLSADLRQLAGARSQFLGQALIVALIRGIAPHKGHAERIADLIKLLDKTIQDLPADQQEPLLYAPALRLSLCALREGPQTAPIFEQISTLLPELTASLPAPSKTRDQGLAGSPLYDTIVTVFSCLPNLTTRVPPMRAGWLSLLGALDIPYVIVVGNGGGRIEGDGLHVDAPDDYEGLPQKTLATLRWVHDTTRFAHMLKIDDDCFLNVEEFFHSLSYRKYDYYGRVLTRNAGQMDRAWHNEKSTSERGRLELDKSPEPSTYTDGGSGYVISRTAMAAAIDAMDSPEGQSLIQVSFMEDKMLGDLLALRGIRPVEEDYRISIRRRTWGKATPVSRWVNSFDASPAAPVKLVHLDAHDTQAPALETLSKPVLTPKKIWPSYQDVALVYQSNALELISSEDRLDAARTADVAVVACMRNEMFMLPQFLAHYRKLGVTSFMIVDNCSDDGTLEYLLKQPDVALFSVDTDYNLSFYGVAWQQALMAAFRVGKWSLVADADELLVWQEKQTQTLPDLLKTDEFQGVDAARIFMLDMYPKGSLSKATFKTDPFAETGYVDRQPFLANWTGSGPFSNMPTWTSALRHRLIAGSRTDLFVAQKIALLKYQPWMRVSAGLHFLTDVQLSSRELLFGHFKYNADFRRKAQAEVARGQHFNDAEEYRKYLALTSEGRDVIYEEGLSVPWTQAPFVRALIE
jgi:glycosyltransferase involved in cell wall biosynthesis